MFSIARDVSTIRLPSIKISHVRQTRVRLYKGEDDSLMDQLEQEVDHLVVVDAHLHCRNACVSKGCARYVTLMLGLLYRGRLSGGDGSEVPRGAVWAAELCGGPQSWAIAQVLLSSTEKTGRMMNLRPCVSL